MTLMVLSKCSFLFWANGLCEMLFSLLAKNPCEVSKITIVLSWRFPIDTYYGEESPYIFGGP